MRSWAFILLAATLVVLAACGGDDEPATTASTETTSTAVEDTGPCAPIEEVDVLAFGEHEGGDFTAADYETNPPAGGDHNPEPLQSGTFYPEPDTRLGEAVHLLEHGGVIGWTNGLARAEQKAIEEAFNKVFQEGYYQLATVENPELEVPFALSAWGAIQTCVTAAPEAIAPFVEEWYASPKSGESGLACDGTARRLPPC